jgi:hypothetical protein
VFGTVGLGVLALAWTSKKERDDYGSAHWQTKAELAKNDMLYGSGKGFVCGKLGSHKSKGGFISSAAIPHVMMVAPTRAGKGVGFVIPNLMAFAGSVVVLDVKGENFEKTSRLRAINGDEVYRFGPLIGPILHIATTLCRGFPRHRHSHSGLPRSAFWQTCFWTRTTRPSTRFPKRARRYLSLPAYVKHRHPKIRFGVVIICPFAVSSLRCAMKLALLRATSTSLNPIIRFVNGYCAL